MPRRPSRALARLALLATSIALSACASGTGTATDALCAARPPNQSVVLDVADQPILCVPADPVNSDALCRRAATRRLEARAVASLTERCTDRRGVHCVANGCAGQCVPIASVTASKVELVRHDPGCPDPPNQDACRLTGAQATCDCLCRVPVS